MGSDTDLDSVFDDGDPFDCPLWRKAELMAGAPPRPAKGYVLAPMAWLAQVLPIVRSAEQLMIAQLIYSECLRKSSKTVSISNHALKVLRIDRHRY